MILSSVPIFGEQQHDGGAEPPSTGVCAPDNGASSASSASSAPASPRSALGRVEPPPPKPSAGVCGGGVVEQGPLDQPRLDDRAGENVAHHRVERRRHAPAEDLDRRVQHRRRAALVRGGHVDRRRWRSQSCP